MVTKKTNSPTVEEVLAQKAALSPTAGDGPKADRPMTVAAPIDGDPGHVNPALNPAEPAPAAPERIPVPVINDPGLLSNPPSLADLNRAAIGRDVSPPVVSEEAQQNEIKAAAEARIAAEKKAAEV